MKKYLILLIIPLLFFSTGCEEEDNPLYPDIIGVWCSSEEGVYDWDCHSFTSSGVYVGFDYNDDYNPENYDRDGIWMVESGYLFIMDENVGGWDEEVYQYNISGNTLTLTPNYESGGIYIKQ